MTLVEVLVTLALLAILTSLVAVMLLRAKTTWQASTARASARQDLQELSWRIARELQGSSGVFLTDGGPSGLQAFSFVSAAGPEGRFLTSEEGAPAWQRHVVYYLVPGTTRLLRQPGGATAILELQARQGSAHGGQESLGRRLPILLYNE
jgi:type II secretory pathway pseudopilin PulG